MPTFPVLLRGEPTLSRSPTQLPLDGGEVLPRHLVHGDKVGINRPVVAITREGVRNRDGTCRKNGKGNWMQELLV